MFFTDQAFFIFLPIVVALYWMLPFAGQNLLLLIASYVFYGYAVPWTIWIMATVTTVNWGSALLIEKYPARKKAVLVTCCILSLLPLLWFKYAMFILGNIKILFPSIDLVLRIFLPAGISFFTFQGLAYTADVYMGKKNAEKNFLRFALFKVFFPQLVAGPIERAGNLLTQINKERRFSWEQFFGGIDLLLRGYLKKIVIADNIAAYVNMIFDLKHPSSHMVLVGGIGFSIQILADFSAYTDIARGCARLMGFELMENFNHPYVAKSPSDFWRRWHISLSNCIRDYLYIPLGGSQVSTGRWLVNIFVVWFICGLWHGAGWNFIAWGLFWGSLIVIYRFTPTFPDSILINYLRIGVMYIWIVLGWIIFRTHELKYFHSYISHKAFALNANHDKVTIAILSIFILYAVPLVSMYLLEGPVRRLMAKSDLRPVVRTVAYMVAGLFLVIFAAEQGVDFYYFQF